MHLCTKAQKMHVHATPHHPQETTNYHFDVSPKDLKGALDRFAQVRPQPCPPSTLPALRLCVCVCVRARPVCLAPVCLCASLPCTCC